ncbi:MAG: sugar phosphate nucleotidyltransferase [Acidimicrobiales bacterium]
MRGVILAGGTGSRLHPLTTVTNKHLLPVHDRPMICWAIEAVVSAGVTEVMLVTGGPHQGDFLRLLGNGRGFGLELLTYSYQDAPGGIAQALGLAEHFIGEGPVVVMLADNIFGKSIAGCVEAFRLDPSGARILVSEVANDEHLCNLGVPELDGDGRVLRIVEKPDKPPSSLAVTGLYCYDSSVFEVITKLAPSGRGELEITDVNNHYAGIGALKYDVLDGFWGDAGESVEAYQAVNDFVRVNGANRSS